MEEVVNPSMEMVSAELSKQGIQCYIHDEEEDRIGLEVDLRWGYDNLTAKYDYDSYYSQPAFALAGLTDEEKMKSINTIVLKFISQKEGGQD